MSDMEDKIVALLEKPISGLSKEDYAVLSDYNHKQKIVSSVLAMNREIEISKTKAMHKETYFCAIRSLIAKHFVLGVKFTNQPMMIEVCCFCCYILTPFC